MIIVVQRVSRARVLVDEAVVGEIETGLALLVCALSGDGEADINWLADKVCDLRLFPDSDGRTNLALTDVGGGALVIPQFTLAADWRKGRRPSFTKAAPPEEGRVALERFAARLVA
ncbi:MAG: D-tyrosyl-tRNA(Tyr) deacylase, partial [Pseudohongiellaceae bacterium]